MAGGSQAPQPSFWFRGSLTPSHQWLPSLQTGVALLPQCRRSLAGCLLCPVTAAHPSVHLAVSPVQMQLCLHKDPGGKHFPASSAWLWMCFQTCAVSQEHICRRTLRGEDIKLNTFMLRQFSISAPGRHTTQVRYRPASCLLVTCPSHVHIC